MTPMLSRMVTLDVVMRTADTVGGGVAGIRTGDTAAGFMEAR
jgi:hypothetical protein